MASSFKKTKVKLDLLTNIDILMILKLLLNTRMIWMVYIKTIKNTTQLKKINILIIFDDMIADMLSNKKLNPVVTELFIRGGKLNISIVFSTQYYFVEPKIIRLNSTRYFIIKILNKRELQQIAYNHSSDIDFKDFLSLYLSVLKTVFFFSIDATLAPDNPLRIKKNISETI